MPRRTNPRQQVIELAKRLMASPNCVVTASKMLHDVVTGAEREVDVVAEYDVDGDTFMQSLEVTSLSRKANVEWVDQQLRKHENLPTHRLILVSWSGFTDGARNLAAKNPRLLLSTVETMQGAEQSP